jgi:AcrR family transcriptional regulator
MTAKGRVKSEEGAGPTTERRSRRRRKELIDAAAKIFQEKGYEAASIQDIAEALGILKGSIYYYIDSKDDLLFAVIQEVHETALANVERLRQIDADALTKIRMFIAGHIRQITENLVKATVFFHDFRALTEERRQYIVAERALYTNYLRELIGHGQTEGTICPDVDANVASMAILGAINWTYQWYHPEGDRNPMEIGHAFADLVLGGITCSLESHRPGHRGQLGQLPAGLDIGEHGRPIWA